MNANQIGEIVSRIQCVGFRFRVAYVDASKNVFLQVELAHAADIRGRKWYVSPYCTESEIVQTALAAVLAFAEHEIRETFQYKQATVYGPHFPVSELVKLTKSVVLDRRESSR